MQKLFLIIGAIFILVGIFFPILKKHNASQEDLSNTLDFFSRHPKLLDSLLNAIKKDLEETYKMLPHEDETDTKTLNNSEIINILKQCPFYDYNPNDNKKSNINIFENTLHLDCCFQTISKDKAIICPDGFRKKEDVEYLIKLFGKKNIFLASPEETFMLTSNVLVISPEIIVSHSKFKRLNKWLEEKGVLVEKVDYSNVSKMSGLFRCSTLPLTREL